MNRYLKYIIASLTLFVLLIGLNLPIAASHRDGISSQAQISRNKPKGGDNPPWDPGDEILPVTRDMASILPDFQFFGKQNFDQDTTQLIARKSGDNDPPWDPGEESTSESEVSYA